MADLRLANLTKIFPGPVRAVDALDLAVGDGQLLALVGPSGCGKTTLLRLIAGLEQPTSGSIVIGGQPADGQDPRQRDLAMVFQGAALYPHMTAYQNLAFALKVRHLERPEIDRQVRQVAAMLGIESLLERRATELSAGQRQRVAIGRAIVRRPRAFLLDEPLCNLDGALRSQMRSELKRLHARLGVTTIHVTHDDQEAMTLGDRLAVMKDGRILQCDSPLAVYQRPANRFVAGFVGSPPMNFLAGVLSRRDGRAVLAGAGWELDLGDSPAARRAGDPGRAVVLGVRPEAMRAGQGASSLPVTLTLIEPTGEKVDLLATLPDGSTVVARLGAEPRFQPGQALHLAVDPQRVHLFEPGDHGTRLT